MIPGLQALGRKLRRAPVSPASVAALLECHEAYLAFRRILREIFPEEEAEILATHQAGGSRENARVWEFLHLVEARYFPVYEVDDYEQVVCGIPFVRNGWGYDRFHELDLRTGELLLFALCAQPFEPGYDTRLSILDAAESHVPRCVLSEIPEQGFDPAGLHERLDGTPYVAAAEFADWLWGATDTVFLDLDDEVEVMDADWTKELVLELAGQWRRASGILDHITEFASWLEADPPAHFAKLLDAALGRDAHLDYLRIRRFYACEITQEGLVPIPHDEPITLPLDVAS